MADQQKKTGPFALPPLPYAENALEPVISAETMKLHHGKHHKAYVEKLNTLVADTPYAAMKLAEVVKKSRQAAKGGDKKAQEIFNNAAQAWNHDFFWKCLSPEKSEPKPEMSNALKTSFGGIEEFRKAFVEAGVKQFGSGWVWLVANGDKLVIEPSHDAMTPMADGKTCLLTIDVWEHAYYVDYRNKREDFLKAVAGKLLNWNFALENMRSESYAGA